MHHLRLTYPLAILALIALMLAPAAARADNYTSFVQKMGDTALTNLTGKELTTKERETRVRDLLNRNFDVDTIGKFALGRHWRTATSGEQKEFLSLFENMIVKTYTQRFGEYSGQQFKVGNSKKAHSKSDDYIVTSQVIQKDGPPVNVEWRVRSIRGQLKVIDVIIENVSMGVTQRSDFDAVIQRGGGKVSALLDSLKKHQAH
jgi:phospholipid transport system substrate-binding protein